jgi:O-antigen/teichoic acid export membrane protein
MSSSAPLEKILKMFGVLVSGSVAASVLGVVVASLITKNLSLETYGLVVMLQAYVMFVDLIFNFQSWQSLIKYASVAQKQGNKAALLHFFQLGIFLDFLGSTLAFCFSLVLLQPLSWLFKFDASQLQPYQFFSIVILFRMVGTSTAILRLTDQYKLFNYQQLINWGGKLFFVAALAWQGKLDMFSIFVVFAICECASSVFLIFCGLRGLKKFGLSLKEVLPGRKTFQLNAESKRFLKFSLRTNLDGAILGGVRTVDELIIGALVSPAAAAIFKVMKLVATIVSKALDPLYTIIYPELARLVAEFKFVETRHILKRISLINFSMSLLVLVLFYFLGEQIITLLFTPEYLLGLPMIQVYLIAVLVSFTLFYLQPLMLSFEMEGAALAVNSSASFVYLTLLLFLIPKYELWAVVIAFSTFTFMVTIPKLYLLQRKTQLFSRPDGQQGRAS